MKTKPMSQDKIKLILEDAYTNGHTVEIWTESSVYDNAIITSCGDTMVGFTAMHSIKDTEYDFEFYLSALRLVKVI